MDSPTFHLFPRLPAELRLHIWQQACLPSQQYHGGLHYFNLDDQKKLIPFGWKGEPQADQRRSAYLWHGGLWTACRESRAVVMKHSRLMEWKEFQEKADLEGKYPPYCDPDWIGEKGDAHPGLIVMSEDRDEWYLMVYPARDTFCITTENCEVVQSSWERHCMLHSVPFAGNDWNTLCVSNLALEFDPSWNAPFPRHIFDLTQEQSPRGLLARMIDEMRDYSDPNFWVIDKSVRWLARSNIDHRVVFYDCDHEYVQIRWHETCFKHADGVYRSPVAKFINNVAHLCNAYYTALDYPDLSPGYHDELVDGFRVQDCISLLVRRDNRVVESDGQGDEDDGMETEVDDYEIWL